MKKISFFGGSGGLGTKIIPYLNDYNVDILSSKKINITDYNKVKEYFENNSDIDVVIIFTNYNFNSFLHKYNNETISEINKQIDVNIVGVLNVITESLKIMRNNNYGRIILASSVTTDVKVIGTSVYSACKSFYENLVKSICIENANKNITANCIKLGYMDGGLTYSLDDKFIKHIIDSIPTKRLGDVSEIYSTIDFIIKNGYINGTTIDLTGGL